MAVSALAQNASAGGGNHNPITGAFGRGAIVPFYKSGTFTAPFDGLYRVRLWGGGGGGGGSYVGGGGGGFAMKTIELNKGQQIAVTIGQGGEQYQSGQTSSFGVHVSATGGSSSNSQVHSVGGSGIGGDINFTGGGSNWSSSTGGGGGGAASVLGDGGHYRRGAYYYEDVTKDFKSASGSTAGTGETPIDTVMSRFIPFQRIDSIDQIGTSLGETSNNKAGTGGGGYTYPPGFPAGGGGAKGAISQTRAGANGLVIVEY